jgi:hypothetical protein
MKKLSLVMILCLVSWQMAWAGQHEDKAQMEMIKAEFAKCMMCKNYLPVFDELMPVLQTEFVQLDGGMAMMHTVSDPDKVELLHQASAKLAETAGTAMQLSDEDAKTQLCMMCQEMRSLAHEGAQVTSGLTKNGDLVVLMSKDPKVQAQISTFKGHCEAMMSGGH